ncbi:unnamed protein product, partial [Brenthis ino]
MKSKSIELQRESSEKTNQNKTYDFVNFYKPCNVKLIEKRKSDDSSSKENENLLKTKEVVKREHSPNKKKKKFKNDNCNVEEGCEPHGSKNSNDPNITSTPNAHGKKDINANVKSIMKITSVADNSFDISTISTPNTKPKKRNKSVSFLLEESKDVIVKRSKSEQSVSDNSKSQLKSTIKNKKQKKKVLDGNESQGIANLSDIDIDNSDRNETNSLKIKNKATSKTSEEINIELTEKETKREKKRYKKQKKSVAAEITTDMENDNKPNVEGQIKVKKLKKNKLQSSQSTQAESIESDDKSDSKSSKKELKPEVIAQDLQNLNIGDNPHTLTNLLDEMAVVDKNKKKKDKKKFKKSSPKNGVNSSNNNNKSKTGTTNEEQESNEEKEKVKWMKRKWNKDKKGAVNDEKLLTSIIVENLPLKIMCNYKKLLTDHFVKFGIIKQVGVAELYSIEDPEVFTTTINFYSEDAAKKSLEEDNTLFEGNRIRIKRPMPPTQTTLVVRSYSDLSEPALSSVFTSAGKIRNVRRLVKGKKSMSTAFVEFDGPEAVKRAIKMAEDVKIGGKKIFVAKFEIRNKSKKQKKESENEENTEDSEE